MTHVFLSISKGLLFKRGKQQLFYIIALHYQSILLLFQKNVEVRKNVQNLVNDSYGGISTKLQNLLSSFGKTQLYFQESVIAMQQTKSDASDIPQELQNVSQTSKNLTFPKSI